ncbi:hypothetical protein K469DRAFT_715159 [Zopfia rhizophila CBS 207.26]|uniref:Uncharacterized protein n=1 Tax=Zopfia rhizophila CBS 207.26 TaxID=1314779 RepID=A0A6A6EQ61_9PEZI|nr:hypothetical protein K469DRAFT_715159 [Zopfia rhizophila CBS 207.26]
MHSLWTEVLSTHAGAGLVWAGDVVGSLRHVQNVLKPGESCQIPYLLAGKYIKATDVKEYCAWRAKTNILLAAKIDNASIRAPIDDITDVLREDLEPFLTCKRTTMWDELRDLVVQAVALDAEISKSRALFAFAKCTGASGQSWGFQFHDAMMESDVRFDVGHPGMNVELVVAPFFVKAGTADGDAYDTQSCLSKCVVVCTETRKKMVGTF